ncbi:(+)-trans-carveol dehydrogenase [Rhodococcus rhodochrous J3]|jgi:(+)-trans-carveol dehydrogenase|uniref:Mycofactocin-coupled SDR family oxidoreductase n=2 Tax=Rhodococcus rhodochrous TaxID=1829 RepID=A0AA47ABG2_RHORH|nr:MULTISPECIES: mycofactocin-coupled SDR family oxidoreductase [Rhodococcus]MBF4480237.1 mycofactocin-coupled SDR family oxidoreductase [Rhodococcus rhodochrous]MCB8910690.1 mycofactocin-coupled SDR family oxidoreductase [Rhodococcus rhodochrous]MCD2114190.1 mycofactocin-coupled SDR family oxidoreductase [Rhodococcus rhodochrous]MDC3724317.1 mycofactocin-coupled SDR family oxidoreductase [Rhodococcus sp. Rp3]MDJ0401281.1 mycofactocin-coupled SDR family oxidoreductase [Rhodococcus rhodochrous]
MDFDGKVAFVTGAARGQGRNHAVRLAREGADIIALDLCAPVAGAPYDMATSADLDETVHLVEAEGRRIEATVADVRDADAVTKALARGIESFGRLDVVVANAGIAGSFPVEELTDEIWRDMIDINLTGVWNTVKASVPHLRAGGRGGSIVLISSIAGLKGLPNNAHYAAAKHGVLGIMRSLANELGPEGIRVNAVLPTNVDTRMLLNDAIYRLFLPDADAPTRADVEPLLHGMHALDVPFVHPDDVSNAVLFLAGDRSRYVTGITMPIDAGALVK